MQRVVSALLRLIAQQGQGKLGGFDFLDNRTLRVIEDGIGSAIDMKDHPIDLTLIGQGHLGLIDFSVLAAGLFLQLAVEPRSFVGALVQVAPTAVVNAAAGKDELD